MISDDVLVLEFVFVCTCAYVRTCMHLLTKEKSLRRDFEAM